jgi:nicotinamidase-related amidase
MFAEGLTILPGDIVVHKTTADSFHRTELNELLKSRGVSELVVGGIQTDFCVDTSIRRALALGYEVVLISNGHTTLANAVLSPEQIIAHHNITLSSITSFGPKVQLIPAEEVHFVA